MNPKHLYAGVLLTAVLGTCAIQAQPMLVPGNAPPAPPMSPGGMSPPPNPGLLPPPIPGQPPAAAIANPYTMPAPVSPSSADWLNGSSCNCCGPTGGNGPIGSELFLANGPSIPGGPGIFGRFLNTGWMVEGGMRSLFFNVQGDAAWTLTLGALYQYNNGSGNVGPFNFFNIPALPVTVRELHRYAFTFGAGRDWFLYGRGQDCNGGPNVRAGIEGGGRYGGERLNLNLIFAPANANDLSHNNFLHRYDQYGAVYVSPHIDVEIPMGSWVWFGGFRLEWAYDFSHVMPFQNSNLNDVNLLFNTGFRY